MPKVVTWTHREVIWALRFQEAASSDCSYGFARPGSSVPCLFCHFTNRRWNCASEFPLWCHGNSLRLTCDWWPVARSHIFFLLNTWKVGSLLNRPMSGPHSASHCNAPTLTILWIYTQLLLSLLPGLLVDFDNWCNLIKLSTLRTSIFNHIYELLVTDCFVPKRFLFTWI